jgi:hypothetical protein
MITEPVSQLGTVDAYCLPASEIISDLPPKYWFWIGVGIQVSVSDCFTHDELLVWGIGVYDGRIFPDLICPACFIA